VKERFFTTSYGTCWLNY